MIKDLTVNVLSKTIQKQAKKIISDLLSELSERERLILYLRFVKGLSYKEISKRTGVPINTVSTTIYRAIRKLREKLRELGIWKFYDIWEE